MISRSRPIQRVLSYLRLYRRWLGTQLPRADTDEIAYHVAAESGSLEAADRLLESIYEHFRCWSNIGSQADDSTNSDAASVSLPQINTLYRVEVRDLLNQRVVRCSRDLDPLLLD